MAVDRLPRLSRRDFLRLAAVAGGALFVEGPEASREYPISSHPAGVNFAAVENGGINIVTPETFGKYLRGRLEDLNGELRENPLREAVDARINMHDRMFHQLTAPVGGPKGVKGALWERGLDFDLKNDGQGLGFTPNDLANLRTSDLLGRGDLLRKGNDGYSRGWAIVEAKEIDKALLAYVDGFLSLQGKDPFHPAVQEERRRLFERIAYDDLAIQPQNVDGKWWTIGPDFDTNETYLGYPLFGPQLENVARVSFRGGVEKPGNGREEEIFRGKDSGNPVLLAAVTDGQGLRVEVFSLANTPDLYNRGLEKVIGDQDSGDSNGSPCGVDGGRFVPVGGVVREVPRGEEYGPQQGIPTTESTPKPTPEPTLEPTPETPGENKRKCNQGIGNGPEGCDPGNSNNRNPSNDERGQTPGNHPPRSERGKGRGGK